MWLSCFSDFGAEIRENSLGDGTPKLPLPPEAPGSSGEPHRDLPLPHIVLLCAEATPLGCVHTMSSVHVLFCSEASIPVSFSLTKSADMEVYESFLSVAGTKGWLQSLHHQPLTNCGSLRFLKV